MKNKDDRIEIEENEKKDKMEEIAKLATEPFEEEFASEENISDTIEWEDTITDEEIAIHEILDGLDIEEQLTIISDVVTVITEDIMTKYNNLRYTEQTKKEDYLIILGMLQVVISTIDNAKLALSSPTGYGDINPPIAGDNMKICKCGKRFEESSLGMCYNCYDKQVADKHIQQMEEEKMWFEEDTKQKVIEEFKDTGKRRYKNAKTYDIEEFLETMEGQFARIDIEKLMDEKYKKSIGSTLTRLEKEGKVIVIGKKGHTNIYEGNFDDTKTKEGLLLEQNKILRRKIKQLEKTQTQKTENKGLLTRIKERLL